MTLNVKDDNIRNEINKERTIMMDDVFWFFTLMLLFAFIINLSNFLISGQAEMTVIIGLGINWLVFLIWKILKCFSNTFPRFIFPLFYLFVVVFVNIAIK